MSVYAATKAFVLSFSESLQSELRQKGDLSVTVLCPGPTATNFAKVANMGEMEELFNRMSMSPARVAKEGFEALIKGKTIVIPGKRYSIGIATASRLVSRKSIQRMLAKAMGGHPFSKS